MDCIGLFIKPVFDLSLALGDILIKGLSHACCVPWFSNVEL